MEEGPQYSVGNFDMEGNRRFSTDELMVYYPSARVTRSGAPPGDVKPFNRSEWDAATEKVGNLYANNGYIYAQVVPEETRRTGADGKPYVDLGWTVREGSPATINKIEIVGNDVTHERVIREAIVMLPGDLFSRDRLIRSYQNVSNLGFFQQPMPSPDVKPSENGVDVDIIFRVEERRTGNINFGASLGQGTGVGGFLGLEEPNLFGRGKRGRLQWQFGKNINDFTLSYTDPEHPGEPDLGHRVALRQPRPVHRGRSRAAGSRPAARSSWASPSSARATPGSSPPIPSSASATARARRTCGSASAAPPAPGHPSAPASSGTPGSACPSPPAGPWPR